MDRRRFLQTLAIGTAPALAGCPEEGRSTDSAPTVSSVETSYPLLAGAYYTVTAKSVDDPGEASVAFEDLSAPSRLELANAVSRIRYLSEESRLLVERYHEGTVAYRNSTFDVRVGVGDDFDPEHGPKFDPDWTQPVVLAAHASDGELAVSITNDLDAPLAVHHYGRPYFGVLLAVGETAAVLGHDAYRENEHVQTSGTVTTERVTGGAWRTETLSPGESLGESYAIPREHPAESTIWLSMPIGDRSSELFGNANTTVTGTIALGP